MIKLVGKLIGTILGVLLGGLLGFLIWNFIVCNIFDIATLGYWQAVLINIGLDLLRLMFKGK